MISTWPKNFLKTTFVGMACASIAQADNHSMMAVDELTLQLPDVADFPPVQPYKEYQINACALILHTPDVVCMPTEGGGFVLVPISEQFASDTSLLGATISTGLGLTGYVVDEDDLIDFPPNLWPLIRPRVGISTMQLSSRSISPDLLSNLEAQEAEVVVTLPDNTSCAAADVITITNGSIVETRCP
jgi:hypothetical protein